MKMTMKTSMKPIMKKATPARKLLGLCGALLLAGGFAGCGGGGGNRCAQVQLSWAINEIGTNVPLACEEVPADTVSLQLNGTTFDFPCRSYAGLTTSVRPGTYAARVGLFDNGQSVSETPTMNITLPGCGTFDLNGNAPVVFDVN